jgi:hypothetical protein
MDSDNLPRLKLFFHELLFNFWGVIKGSDVVDISFVLDGNRLGPHCDHIALKFISLGFMSGKDGFRRGYKERRKQKKVSEMKGYSTTSHRLRPVSSKGFAIKISVVRERHRPSIDFLLVNTDLERFQKFDILGGDI